MACIPLKAKIDLLNRFEDAFVEYPVHVISVAVIVAVV